MKNIPSTPRNTSYFDNLNPWFVTGFSDAESCFSISVSRNSKCILGWQTQLEFQLSALNNPANLQLLENFQHFFKGGRINLNRNQLY